MATGLVFNIQRYCVHDGPGIRTTVFLKGCPLQCWWCHNPESRSPDREIGVSASRCVRCGTCLEVCPQSDDGRGVEAAEGLPLPGPLGDQPCLQCGACVEHCPAGARQWIGDPMTVDQVMEKVLRDRIFYDQSNGGVTVSGGEPLMQWEFLVELLTACRDADIHTAVDTSGHASPESLSRVLPLVDLFLYDLKALDDATHRRHTGASNELILRNLRTIAETGSPIWLRVPLVPGMNDHERQLSEMARFAKGLGGIEQVHVLPYHNLGSHKGGPGCHGTERTTVSAPDHGTIQWAVEIFRTAGLKTIIGG